MSTRNEVGYAFGPMGVGAAQIAKRGLTLVSCAFFSKTQWYECQREMMKLDCDGKDFELSVCRWSARTKARG